MKTRHMVTLVSAAALLAGCSSGAGTTVTVTVASSDGVTTQTSAAASSTTETTGYQAPQVTSLEAQPPVPFASSPPGAQLANFRQIFPVSADAYGMIMSDTEDQDHVVAVSAETGKILWETEALPGPRINPTTGQRSYQCVALDSASISCGSGLLVDAETGKMTVNTWTAALATKYGYITGTPVDGKDTVTAFAPDGVTVIWQKPAYRLLGSSPAGNVVAYQLGNQGDIQSTVELSAETGDPVSSILGRGQLDGNGWFRVPSPVGTSGAGPVERVDAKNGATLWKYAGDPTTKPLDSSTLLGTYFYGSTQQIDPSQPGPTVLSVNGDPASASPADPALVGVDSTSGEELWKCTTAECGGATVLGATPNRIVTANALVDSTTGTKMASWAASAESVGTSSQSRVILTSGYVVAVPSSGVGVKAFSFTDGAQIWSADQTPNALVRVGECFIAVSKGDGEGDLTQIQLSQTRICPS